MKKKYKIILDTEEYPIKDGKIFKDGKWIKVEFNKRKATLDETSKKEG